MLSTFSPTSRHTLPVSPDVLERGFLRFSVQDPPFVPSIQIEEWMFGYVKPVAGLSAAIIQQHAEDNALRRFVFNLFSRDDFRNEEFAALVKGILDCIVLTLVERPDYRVEENLEAIVRENLELTTVKMTEAFPALQNSLRFLNQEELRRMDDLIRAFNARSFEIERFRAQRGYLQYRPGTMRNDGPMYDATGGASRFGGARMSGIYPDFGRDAYSSTLPASYGAVQDASALLLGGGHAPHSSTSRPGETFSSRFSNFTDTSEPRYASTNGSTHGNSTMNAVMEGKPAAHDGPLEDAGDTELVWKPYDDQPYHPMYNPQRSQLFYQRLGSKRVFAVVKARGGEMEYDRHRTKSVFGPIPPMLDLDDSESVMDRLQEGLREIREERQAREDNEEPALSTRVRSEVVYEDSSLAGIWLQVAYEWQAAAVDGRRPGIYRLYGEVYDIAVSDRDESGFVEKLRNSGTFSNLRAILDDAFGEVGDSIWYKANERATCLVNRILTLNLGLHDAEIGSFTEDFEPLMQMLRQIWGDAMAEALERRQRHQIAAIYRPTAEKARECVENNMLEASPEPCTKPELTFMASRSSLTFVDCTSHELSVEWAEGTTALVTKGDAPVLHQIVRDIVNEAHELNLNLEQYLLQTSDGKIIEIGSAFLADDDDHVVRLLK
jgi:hypothetical protein